MNYTLEVTDLTKDYGDFRLNKLSFSIPQGSIMGLIGENGAGKTTTINIILNEIKKDDGTVKVFGKNHLECEQEIKTCIGVVFDDFHLPDLLTANEVEKFISKIYSQWQHRVYQEYLSKFELPSNKPIKDFSRGMKVKLSFAIALSHNAKFLILDEATSGLDPIVRDEILDILLEFVQDKTHSVLFSSQITSDLAKVADYITFVHKGNLIFSKPKDELIYNFGIIHCGATVFNSLDKSEIISYRKQDYEWQALVANREAARKEYKNCIVDNATIDDIMLFYIKGEK